MDLFAYAQISDLEKIAEDNGIEVPRLRGYRLMKDEEPVSLEEIQGMIKDCEIDVCRQLCCSNPFWSIKPKYREYSRRTNSICSYFLVETVDEKGRKDYTAVRWDRIHGRKRKILKFAIKKQKQRIQQQYETWNKYVGREDVLYIHSRIGGNNWSYYGGEKLKQRSWFLEKVDDCYDRTYCDIYATIKV